MLSRVLYVACILVLTVFGNAPTARGADRQILLIQNSGWMEPFFEDPNSQFVPLLQAFAAATAAWGGDYYVATFNQDGQLPEQKSPNLLYGGQALPNEVSAAVSRISLPKRPDGKYTDADFKNGLIGAITNILGNTPGVIWMVTNNKNSPNNSQEVIRNTRGFFEKLRESDTITRIVSFPLRMSVHGKKYSEGGLIIYGIALGEDGAATLARLEASQAVRNLIADPAVLLKPLHQAPLAFVPHSVEPEGAKAEFTDGMLRVWGLPGDSAQEIVVRGDIVSGYYPHVIRKAVLSGQWSAIQGSENLFDGTKVAISPGTLENVMPVAPYGGIELRFSVPAVPRPEGVEGLFKSSRQVVGALQMDLRALRLEFAPAFVEKISAVTAMDQLPELFFDHQKISHATAVIPVGVELSYSALPMIAALTALALLVGGGVVGFLAFQPRSYPVSVNGRTMQARLRPFQSTVLQEPNSGQRVEVTRAGFGGPSTKPL